MYFSKKQAVFKSRYLIYQRTSGINQTFRNMNPFCLLEMMEKLHIASISHLPIGKNTTSFRSNA